jgi:hypothetical protein
MELGVELMGSVGFVGFACLAHERWMKKGYWKSEPLTVKVWVLNRYMFWEHQNGH